MQVRVLGPVEVRTSADAAWHRPPPQQRLVLGALVAADGRVREAGALVDALWGDSPPRNAHRLLQALVSRLRAALGQEGDGGPLQAAEHGWQLVLPPDATDVGRFESALDRARVLAADGDKDGAGALLDEALAQWRGRPFGDLAEEACLVADAHRLEERRLDAVQLRLHLRLGTGEHARVVAELKELLGEHPLREQLWALLMVALCRAGRQAEALVAYQRVRERLVDELGVEPGEALQRLHRRVLEQRLDDEVIAEAVGATSGTISTPRRTLGRTLPRPLTSFVGRTRELEELTALLDEARLVTVLGPGGVGKSRLAIAAAEAALERDDGLATYHVELAHTAPEQLDRAVASAVGAVEEAATPLRESVVDRLRRGPVLLLLATCERLRAEVGDLLDDLLRRCPELVVLATSRERLGVVGERVLPLGPLGVGSAPWPVGDVRELADEHAPAEAEQLLRDRVRAVAPHVEVRDDLVHEVCRRLDGLPLAIELAAARVPSLGLDGLLAGLDDRLRLLEAAPGSTGRHRSLRAVLDWSHELLDADERAALRRLSVFTTGFDLAAAAAVLGDVEGEGDLEVDRPAPAPVVADLIGRLVDKSMLLPHHDRGGSRWRWLDSVRDYAARLLDESGEGEVVRRRHLRWAAGTADDLLGRLESGDAWRAAFRRVEGDLDAALRASETLVPSAGGGGRDRFVLALATATLQARSGSSTNAKRSHAVAVVEARRLGNVEDLAEAALGASVSGMTFGVSDPERVTWLEEALAGVGDEPGRTRVRLLARLALELYWSVDRERAHGLVAEAVDTARALGDDAALASALHALHYTSRGTDAAHTDVAAHQLSAQVVRHADRARVGELALAGRAANVVDLLATGDLVGVEASLVALRREADRLGVPAYQWYADVHGLVLALLEGRWADADALGATSIAAGRNVAEFTVGLSFAEWVTDLRDVPALVRRNRIPRLEELSTRFPGVLVWRCLALADELALRHPVPRGPGVGLRAVPAPDVVADLTATAEALVDEVLAEPRDAHWTVELCLLAEVVAELRAAPVAARIEEGLADTTGLVVAGRVGACRGSAVHARGLLRLTLDDVDGAIELLEAAAEQHHELGLQPHHARSLAARAVAHEQRGTAADGRSAAELRRRVAELVDLDRATSRRGGLGTPRH